MAVVEAVEEIVAIVEAAADSAAVEAEAAVRTAAKPVVVVVIGVLAILMGPQIKPAGYIGNLASLRTSVWIQLSAPGRTFLHQNLNQINEKLTNSTLKYMTRCMHSLTKKYTLST